MNKVNAEPLSEVVISMNALKQCDEGDEIVLLTADNQAGWFRVERVETRRGCKGGTTLTLSDLASGDATTIVLSRELPEGVVRVRRVSAGVNSRTTRKFTTPQEPKVAIVQPEGEFANILDVELPEDKELTPEATVLSANFVETIPAPAKEIEVMIDEDFVSFESGTVSTPELVALAEDADVVPACELGTAANA